MKVYYHKGNDWNWKPSLLDGEKNLLALSFNNWDDYSISTSCNASLFHNKKLILEFTLKILLEDDVYSPKKLNELREKGWDGFFPIPDYNYVSVPSEIDFYDALISTIGKEAAEHVLLDIRDAGYLEHITKDKTINHLISSPEFHTSPLREAGAKKSYADGWKLFYNIVSTIDDFTLYTKSRNMERTEAVSFSFNSKVLPYDINVLIGPNGIGKSYTLKTFVEYWQA